MLQPGKKITPFLWYENQAEEAANFYVSLFPNARVLDVTRWGKGAPYAEGSVMSALFEIDGQQLMAFNGGPFFKLNEACSLFVSCEDQAEVDHYWDALTSNGGTPSRCAWLKDRYGLSWQIVPKALSRLLSDPDSGRSGRAMKAMMNMGKIDIAELEKAANQAP